MTIFCCGFLTSQTSMGSGSGRSLGVEVGQGCGESWGNTRRRKNLQAWMFMFNTFVAPFSYKAQFAPIPPSVHKYYRCHYASPKPHGKLSLSGPDQFAALIHADGVETLERVGHFS